MLFLIRSKIITCFVLCLFAGLGTHASAEFTVVPFTSDQMAAAFPDGSVFAGGGAPNSWSDTPTTPYGTANRGGDTGWFWSAGGKFTVDFGTPRTIGSVRFWSGFSHDVRGMIMQVRSGDSANLSSLDDIHEFDYLTSEGGGYFDDGSQSNDHSGWYQYDFAPTTAQFWQVTNSGKVTRHHMPRTGGIEFGLGTPVEDATSFEWSANEGGIWKNAKNWGSNTGASEFPSSGEDTALFGNHEKIVVPTTVVVSDPVAINRIEFNNATNAYAIAGTGNLSLAANSAGSLPSVSVQAGDHEFQVRTNLQADTYLNVEAGQSLQFNHRLNLGGNTLTKTGAGSLAINNNLTTGTGGSLNCEGGNCSGSGTVNGALVNGSTVSPGNSPGVLTVDGDYSQGGTATLAIELAGNGGAAGTDYDRLLVWGTANLSGVLDLQVDAGYTPTIGDSMPGIVTAANVNGTFNTTNNVVFNGRQGLAVTYTETSVDAQVALRGNTDVASGDVDVDTGDLTTSIINFTSAGGSGKTWSQGDMDGDGDVDTGDLTTSIINFTSALSGGANTVPEPGSLLLLLMGMMALMLPRRGN